MTQMLYPIVVLTMSDNRKYRRLQFLQSISLKSSRLSYLLKIGDYPGLSLASPCKTVNFLSPLLITRRSPLSMLRVFFSPLNNNFVELLRLTLSFQKYSSYSN